MQTIPRLALLVAAGLLVAASPAAAQSADLGRAGVYLGVGGVGLYESFDADIAGFDVSADDGWGLNGRVGYRVNRFVAVEVLYEWFDEIDLDVGPFDDVASIEAWSLTANLKLYPLAGRIQPYAILGGGLLGGDLEATGFRFVDDDEAPTARLGLGVDLYATDRVLLALEGAYYVAQDDYDDFGFFSAGAGLQFRF